MLRLTNRYVSDHVCVEAVEVNLDNVYVITKKTRHTKEYVDAFTSAMMVQFGGVEFKTIKDLENTNEEADPEA